MTSEHWEPRKAGADGFRNTCRQCRLAQKRATNRRYYRRNAERINAEKRADYAADPEKYRQTDSAVSGRR